MCIDANYRNKYTYNLHWSIQMKANIILFTFPRPVVHTRREYFSNCTVRCLKSVRLSLEFRIFLFWVSGPVSLVFRVKVGQIWPQILALCVKATLQLFIPESASGGLVSWQISRLGYLCHQWCHRHPQLSRKNGGCYRLFHRAIGWTPGAGPYSPMWWHYMPDVRQV